MAIKPPPVRGLLPLEQPIAGAAIAARLEENRAQRDADYVRSETPARLTAANAYKCARQDAFYSLRVPKPIEYTAQQLMTFQAGDFYGQIAGEAAVRSLNARLEVDFDLRPRWDCYGRADGVHTIDGMLVSDFESKGDLDSTLAVLEFKSQSGYGFDLAVGNRRSDEGPGPKIDHLIQAGLGAKGLRARWVHPVYINKDRGTCAEWLIDVLEPLPHIVVGEKGPHMDSTPVDGDDDRFHPSVAWLVAWDLKRRTDGVLALIDAGDLPPRDIPGFGVVVGDPPNPGTRDKPWNCSYCSWQPTCAALAAGRVEGWVSRFIETAEVSA